MCGIVGAVAERNIEQILLAGLKRLEYRGYDSAGLAVLNKENHIQRARSLGKVKELELALTAHPLKGNLGIAHTRWATHGAPSEANAHPLMSSNDFALVHNGIIENHDELRRTLIAEGYQFSSETDTEVVVHLLHFHFQKSQNVLAATRATVKELKGAYALGIISLHYPDHLIAVRHGSPLVIGHGIGENFIASDTLALMPVVQQFIYLEDNDIVDLTRETIDIETLDGKKVERHLHTLETSNDVIDRGEYRHFMSKEIAEQPAAISTCLEGRIDRNHVLDTAFGHASKALFPQVKNIHLVACGTSFHAALVARYWLEEYTQIPCSVEIASEFRYRKPCVPAQTLFVTLSQSGETADTLAALRIAKSMNYLDTLAICNVPESSLVREAGLSLMTRAGIEIGVASTKAFTTQLVSLLLLTLRLGRDNHLSAETEEKLIAELNKLPDLVASVLRLDEKIATLAAQFSDKEHALFLARGSLYPIALEGALKLKELSYIHAEGYAAGELKHGPLALVDKNMPVIALAPNDELLEKIKSNLHEVQARGGKLFIFTDVPRSFEGQHHIVTMPTVSALFTPILYTIPLQMLSYHVAVLKGTDVDQPRNLAKSVTVE